MKKITLTAVVLTIILVACDSQNNNIQKIEKKTSSTVPVVLLILVDNSISAIPEVNMPDTQQLSKLYDLISASHEYSSMALGCIGSAQNSNKPYQRYEDLYVSNLNVNNGSITKRRTAMKKNMAAKKEADTKKSRFIYDFFSNINRVDEETDINAALKRAIRFFQERSFKNSIKILVVISDGMQNTKNSKILKADFTECSEVNLVAVGWKNELTGLKNIRDIEVFEGFGNVNAHITTIIKKGGAL